MSRMRISPLPRALIALPDLVQEAMNGWPDDAHRRGDSGVQPTLLKVCSDTNIEAV